MIQPGNRERNTDEYLVTSGAKYIFSSKSAEMNIRVIFSEPIQKANLQKAAELTLHRYPYFNTRVLERDGACVLEHNPVPFSVFERDGCMPLSDPRAGGYLVTISFCESRLYVSISHGLTDGFGTTRFVRTLVCAYLKDRYGEDLFCPDLISAESNPESSEYADPYQLVQPQDDRFPFYNGPFFKFPEADIGKTVKKTLIHTPVWKVLELSKKAESNFSSVLSMLLSLGIDGVYPVDDAPIGISCPVDMRKMLGCPDLMQNCHCSIKYVYSKKLRKLPMDQQLSCFKGMMLLQTSEEYLLPRYADKAAKFEAIRDQKGTSEAKKERFAAEKSFDFPVVSYFGTVNFGDYGKYVRDYLVDMPLHGNAGMHILSYCFGDDCAISLRSNLIHDECTQSFCRQLEAMNIPYRVEELRFSGAEAT